MDDKEVLYGAAVHDPSKDPFTGRARGLAVFRKLVVLAVPGSDKAAKNLRLIAQ
jgi:hypothetical protein